MKRMKSLMLMAVLALSVPLLAAQALDACSTFLLHEGRQLVYGRNFDFFLGGGYIMTNQRGIAKQALVVPSKGPARWVSRYGSITFNQVSKEYPYGGMNEAGLIVENMWLEWSGYPAPDERAAVPELQWIQYQLDNCASVAEVIDTDRSIRIEPTSSPVHFFVADRSGDAATIEFIEGRMVVHRGSELSVPALTNNTYDESIDYLELHKGFGGEKEIRSTFESLDRFVLIASMLGDRHAARRGRAVDRAFKILDAVSQGEATVWSAVYDMKKRKILFRTPGSKSLRVIDLDEFDFSCSVPSRCFDIEAPAEGDISRRFEDYSTELNRAMVKRTFAGFHENEFMMEVTDAMLDYLARFPETFQCRTDEHVRGNQDNGTNTQ